MSHTPVTRESMRGLKAKRLDEDRIHQINHIVDQIYGKAVHIATNTDDSRYLHMLPMLGRDTYEFHKTNMAEIISRVKSLFPDCSVEHKILKTITAKNGKKYDISKIYDSHISDIKERSTEIGEYIVVDCS